MAHVAFPSICEHGLFFWTWQLLHLCSWSKLIPFLLLKPADSQLRLVRSSGLILGWLQLFSASKYWSQAKNNFAILSPSSLSLSLASFFSFPYVHPHTYEVQAKLLALCVPSHLVLHLCWVILQFAPGYDDIVQNFVFQQTRTQVCNFVLRLVHVERNLPETTIALQVTLNNVWFCKFCKNSSFQSSGLRFHSLLHKRIQEMQEHLNDEYIRSVDSVACICGLHGTAARWVRLLES